MTDTMGGILAATVHAANVNDSKCGVPAARLVAARRLAAHTLTIVRENVALALLAKAACLLLGTFGSVSMAVAVFADVGVMLLTVLNALRALRPPST